MEDAAESKKFLFILTCRLPHLSLGEANCLFKHYDHDLKVNTCNVKMLHLVQIKIC